MSARSFHRVLKLPNGAVSPTHPRRPTADLQHGELETCAEQVVHAKTPRRKVLSEVLGVFAPLREF